MAGTDPPPRPESRARDHLANERTFLAWVRTSLGLTGLGFVLARMGIFLESLEGARPRGGHEFLVTGVFFLVAGTALCMASLWHYDCNRKGIDAGGFEPARGAILGLTAIATAGGLAIIGLVVWHLVVPPGDFRASPGSDRSQAPSHPRPPRI